MDMRLETLREFVVFAKCQNFSAAALELHLSQPAMSVHIANLEKELGFQLVDRKRGAELTPAGQRFLAGVQAALASYDEAVRACDELVKSYPAVRIKTTGDIPFLPDLLARAGGIPFELIELSIDSLAPLTELDKEIVDISTCYDFSFSPHLAADAERQPEHKQAAEEFYHPFHRFTPLSLSIGQRRTATSPRNSGGTNSLHSLRNSSAASPPRERHVSPPPSVMTADAGAPQRKKLNTISAAPIASSAPGRAMSTTALPTHTPTARASTPQTQAPRPPHRPALRLQDHEAVPGRQHAPPLRQGPAGPL